jgi:hypothetical protein
MDKLDGTRLSHFKQLQCSRNKKHVLGVIERMKVNVVLDGTTFTYYSPRLIIFRETVDLEEDAPKEVDVAGTIEGKTLFDLNWKCSVPRCNGIKEWHPEKEIFEYFVKTYLAE